jgi:hypothetical protein
MAKQSYLFKISYGRKKDLAEGACAEWKTAEVKAVSMEKALQQFVLSKGWIVIQCRLMWQIVF